MKSEVSPLLARLEKAATDAKSAEAALRRSFAEEIARLERRRAFAFRRTRLIETLLRSSAPRDAGGDATPPVPAFRGAVASELGWTSLSPAHDEILDRLAPVAAAVARYATEPAAEASDRVISELDAFEAWFEAARGHPFYVLFDQYVPEVPVVDF